MNASAKSSRFVLLLLSSVVFGAGCNRRDTECLSSIGRKLAERAGAATASCRERLDGLKQLRGEGSLNERVSTRLRWEKVLADTPIEVVVSGSDVELKGTVKYAEQRSRAVELAESTAGVEKVVTSLTIAD